MTIGKHIWGEIDDLKEALSQITDKQLELEKAVRHNSCEIGRISAMLEVTAKTAEEAMKCVQGATNKDSLSVEPEKMLYLAIASDGDLSICYGRRIYLGDELMWWIDADSGMIRSVGHMPDLWTEWYDNGCKFDPTPIKWKGKSVEKIYSIRRNSTAVYLGGLSNIINISERTPIPACVDSNIHTDHNGRAFII